MTTKMVPLVGAMVLCAGAAFAAATPPELCNRARVQVRNGVRVRAVRGGF